MLAVGSFFPSLPPEGLERAQGIFSYTCLPSSPFWNTLSPEGRVVFCGRYTQQLS